MSLDVEQEIAFKLTEKHMKSLANDFGRVVEDHRGATINWREILTALTINLCHNLFEFYALHLNPDVRNEAADFFLKNLRKCITDTEGLGKSGNA